MDTSGLQALFETHRRKYCRNALREHCLVGAWRSDQEHVVGDLTTHTNSVCSANQLADEPKAIECYFCGGHMDKQHPVETEQLVQVPGIA
jgi:hypothetical protein